MTDRLTGRGRPVALLLVRAGTAVLAATALVLAVADHAPPALVASTVLAVGGWLLTEAQHAEAGDRGRIRGLAWLPLAVGAAQLVVLVVRRVS